MKLKGCLKGLCTLGLTTLLISFASATFTAHPIGVFTPSVGDSSISLSVMQLGEVYSEQGTIEKFVFAPTNDLLFYWDIDSKPILLLPNCYNDRYGGELKYYYTCDVISDSNFNGMTNCTPFQEINDNYLSEFLGTIRESDSWAYDYHLGMYGFNLCFSSQVEGKSICFGAQSSNYNWWCNMWQSDLTCNNGYCSYTSPFSGGEYTSLTYTLDSIPLEEIGFSPSAPSTPSIPDMSDIIYTYPGLTGINSEYYQAFLDRGYYTGLCYSIFYTGTLVESGDTLFEMFQGDIEDSVYYGHSVFDFYEAENSSLSTHSWSQQRYSLMKYAYEKSRYSSDDSALSSWVGKQKGTFNIMFNIYNNQFNENFNWTDYWTFCDMTVNGFNPGEQFDGDVSYGMEQFTERKRDERQFVLSGVDFSGANDMLGVFNQLYTRARTAFLLDDKNSNITGILPTYIIFGFFMFLLLYGLKR